MCCPQMPNRNNGSRQEPEEPLYQDEVDEVDEGIVVYDADSVEYESEDDLEYCTFCHDGRKYVDYTAEFNEAMVKLGDALTHLKVVYDRDATPQALRAMVMHARRVVHPRSMDSVFVGGILCVHPGCQAAMVQMAEEVARLAQRIEVEPGQRREDNMRITLFLLLIVLTFAKAVLPPDAEDAQVLPAMLRALSHAVAPNDTRLLVPEVLVPLVTHVEHSRLYTFGNPDGWDEDGEDAQVDVDVEVEAA